MPINQYKQVLKPKHFLALKSFENYKKLSTNNKKINGKFNGIVCLE